MQAGAVVFLTTSPNPMTGEEFRTQRKQLRVSQEGLAYWMEASQSQISKLEQMTTPIPRHWALAMHYTTAHSDEFDTALQRYNDIGV